MRKKRTKNKIYSPEFKRFVMLDMREHHFSYCEPVRKYNLESTRIGGAIQMVTKVGTQILRRRYRRFEQKKSRSPYCKCLN